jgi:hypothetical protein
MANGKVKTLGSKSSANWWAMVPLAGGGVFGGGPDLMATASNRLILLPSYEAPEGLAARLKEALDLKDSLSNLDGLEFPTPAFFICETTGFDSPAQDKAEAVFRDARNALAFASLARQGARGLPPVEARALPPKKRMLFIERQTRELKSRPARAKYLGPAGYQDLANPKIRTAYDRAARVLGMYPESLSGAAKNEFGRRLAQSLRIFGRAVDQDNQDLRFLLIVVALETIFSRSKDSPITEYIADVGSIISKLKVDERYPLSREIKDAYSLRSKFVHQGDLPSQQSIKGKGLSDFENVIFSVWSSVMNRLLPFSDTRWKDEEVFQKFAELKLGAGWNDTFKKED